ncbi:collagen alpha-1(III) chain-like [Motacilla alba alba]|uniref:collagen alpha-1(III) chain-like n=1 Tax=Motacilla alba alba TaxID=1094192 RepID=UPI0018D56681|nr:collagen alpha-1(III) chain-like [Motacilla alba alba]
MVLFLWALSCKVQSEERVQPGTRGRGGAPGGRDQGGGAPDAVLRGSRQRPGGSGQRGGSAGLRRARRGTCGRAGGPSPVPAAGHPSAPPQRPGHLLIIFLRARGIDPSIPHARPGVREPLKFANPALLPHPLPPHSACGPGLINLIHLELIVFTFASPPAPLAVREGAGAGPGAEERRRLERSGGAARFEPRQRHLSSTVVTGTQNNPASEKREKKEQRRSRNNYVCVYVTIISSVDALFIFNKG